MTKLINTTTAPRSIQDDSGQDDAASQSSKKQVSKRTFIDASGNEVDKIEEAAGARYTLLVPSGNKTFDVQIGSPGKAATMFGIMGAHTKLGNEANSVLNDKDEPGSPDDAAAAITAWLDQINGSSPEWSKRGSGGGVGAKIDKDALAGAIVAVAEAAGKTVDYAKIRDRLETDPQYVRAARQVPAVANEYATRVGKAGKSIDDLL